MLPKSLWYLGQNSFHLAQGSFRGLHGLHWFDKLVRVTESHDFGKSGTAQVHGSSIQWSNKWISLIELVSFCTLSKLITPLVSKLCVDSQISKSLIIWTCLKCEAFWDSLWVASAYIRTPCLETCWMTEILCWPLHVQLPWFQVDTIKASPCSWATNLCICMYLSRCQMLSVDFGFQIVVLK